jgi:RNA polymerase sigma-70 factor (ECF subfamily)
VAHAALLLPRLTLPSGRSLGMVRRMDAPAALAPLLAAVARGDRAALRAVYDRQSVRLFGVANAILRDRDAAADAVQDAFVSIARRAGQFDPARGPAEA